MLLNSAPETVQTVRSFYISPGGPAPTLQMRATKARKFAALSLKRTEVVGWCWTRTGTDRFTAFALAAGHKPLFIERISGTGPPHPGPRPVL